MQIKTILFFIFITVLFSCKKESSNKSEQSKNPADTAGNVVNSNVHVIDSLKFKINADTALLNKGIYQYSGTVANSIKTGDIIVGETGEGYIRKVTSVNVNGSKITYNTTQASLGDVFQYADIKFNINSAAAVAGNSIGNTRLKTASIDPGNQNTTVAFTKGAISLAGSVNVNPNFVAEIQIVHGVVDYLKLGFDNATLTGNLKLNITGSQGVLLSGEDVIKKLPPIGFIIPVDGIPVKIILSISLHAKYSFQVIQTVSKEIDFTHTDIVSASILYDGSSLTFPSSVPAPGDVITISPFTDNATLNTDISIIPEFDFKIYGILGPYMYIGLNANANGKLNTKTLDWNLGASAWLNATLGLNGTIFGMPVEVGSVDFNTSAISYKTPEFINNYSGDNQTADVNKPLPQPIKILITDTLNKPQPHVPVYFKITSGKGFFSIDTKKQKVDTAKIFTDASGYAQTPWTLGESLDPQKVQTIARWADGTPVKNAPVTFTANAKVKIGDRAFGGIVFYVDNSGKHGLVVDSVNIGNNTPCKITTDSTTCNYASISGSDNTLELINSNSIFKTIALLCHNSTRNGYVDWFLPSQSELTTLYNVKDKIKNLPNTDYWTSTTFTYDFLPNPTSSPPCNALISVNLATGVNSTWTSYITRLPITVNANVRAVRLF